MTASFDCRVGEVRLRVLHWPGASERVPFLLLHGLASNARIWEAVAPHLAAAGHTTYAADLRGHGQSDAPEDGYDFAQVTADVAGLAATLGLGRAVVAGHSWGGLVALDYAASHPLGGLALIDGGFTQLSDSPGATWEKVEAALRPPRLAGTPLAAFEARLEEAHPDWPSEVPWRDILLGNFEVRADGTIAPHLSFDHHMLVVRAMWDFPTYERFGRISCPVLIVAARATGPLPRRDESYREMKRRGEAEARARMPQAKFVWMDETDHDIPLHRPAELARRMLDLAQRVEEGE
ncbi:MAG TPA: alpha/beta hydrolase [Anaerolineales bacterium]|nr:alpha/beta hydrolase [Anaerolineales bacterium]